MKILKPINTSQELDVLVREHVPSTYDITIIDESDREVTLSNVTGVYSNQRLRLSIAHNFSNKSFYLMKIKVAATSGDYATSDYSTSDYFISAGKLDEIYRGKLFIISGGAEGTDLEKYNSITYVEKESTNTFKIRR